MRSFDEAPFLVIWEVTQACDLACVHCRASAQPARHPEELTTAEGFALLEEIRRFGDPLMVFTGGDPLKRADIFDLLAHSVECGLRTTITPSATPLLTPQAIDRIHQTGVARMAVSLDGPDAQLHDGFRGVDGSFDRTIAALEHAKAIGLETQVNTTVTRNNVHRLSEIAAIVAGSGSRLWSVFFLVATGRATQQLDLSPDEYEQVFEFLYDLSLTVPFDIKTTEAQHYRRYTAQQRKASGQGGLGLSGKGSIARQAGINDGKGLLFVSHTGEVCPSGFLPVAAGNFRFERLDQVYRNSALFKVLRDTDQLEGKCGVCQYRNLCGGSRSRAYAITGNYLAEDPNCVFQPA
ncbi:MAG: TIGR04053 family radical SAM/SPASM domain-containing protein [Bryobacterales bacterium]|nr:TIGR04053 family radical SAM/SPASM domain-containing protein [Bryobacterales bacterium]